MDFSLEVDTKTYPLPSVSVLNKNLSVLSTTINYEVGLQSCNFSNEGKHFERLKMRTLSTSAYVRHFNRWKSLTANLSQTVFMHGWISMLFENITENHVIFWVSFTEEEVRVNLEYKTRFYMFLRLYNGCGLQLNLLLSLVFIMVLIFFKRRGMFCKATFGRGTFYEASVTNWAFRQ